MSQPYLTDHAIRRYQERVENDAPGEVFERLNCPAVRAAIKFGARSVRLASGHRVVIKGGAIVTVLPPKQIQILHD